MDLFFLISAVGGGLLFLFQFVFQFSGLFHGGSTDLDLHNDLHTDALHTGPTEHGGDTNGSEPADTSDVSFRYFSFQAMSAFFMIFGLAGLALHRESRLSTWISFPLSVAIGLLTLRIMAWIYRIINSLQSTGNLDLSRVPGSEGRVYARIPAQGSGQVQIRVEGRLRIFDARNASGLELETGTPVRVTSMNPDHTMIVKKVN